MFANALVAAAIVLPFLANSALAADCARSYVVQIGDICDSISAANNASTYQLAVVNPEIDDTCSNLTPGDEICLGTVGEDCTTTYVVQSGDSCGIIETANSINSTILALNNPQINDDCSNVYVGEVLCVADTVLVPPAPAGFTPATTIPATATAAGTADRTFAPETPAPTPTPAPAADNADDGADDGDDDDIPEDQLPFCDEL